MHTPRTFVSFPNRRDFLSAAISLPLAELAARFYAVDTPGPVIVEAGRRVDAAAAETVRFPSSNVPKVRRKIEELLLGLKPMATVSAAACGADLLLLDVADGMGVPRYILLPSGPEEFRQSSVTDRPGNWGELYTKALRSSHLEVLKLPEGQEGYLETNLKLLDRAQTLANHERTTVRALVVWNLVSRGPDDVTEHFLEQANHRRIPITEISTL